MEHSSNPGLMDPITGQQIFGSLNFHGVVSDDNNRAVEGATVMLFACYYDGVERSLGSTFTDRVGAYHLSVPKPPDYDEVLGFKIRAGKALMLPGASNNLSRTDQTRKQESKESTIKDTFTDERPKSPVHHRHLYISSEITDQPYRSQLIRR